MSKLNKTAARKLYNQLRGSAEHMNNSPSRSQMIFETAIFCGVIAAIFLLLLVAQ